MYTKHSFMGWRHSSVGKCVLRSKNKLFISTKTKGKSHSSVVKEEASGWSGMDRPFNKSLEFQPENSRS